MAIIVKKAAKGDGPNTGMAKQPRPAAPDQISKIRAPSAQGYGMNDGASNPSSVPPDKIAQTRSPLAANLAASVDDDGALDRVIKEGTTKQADSITGQLRKIAAGNVADHPHMKSPNKTGVGTYDFDSLPQKLGASAEQPVRKPTE